MKTPTDIINTHISKNIKFPFSKKWVGTIIKAALKKEKITRLVEIDCLITDDSFIQILNRKHRGIDKPTDVLSFAFRDQSNSDNCIDFPEDPYSIINLGSIVVSHDRSVKQASKQKHSIQEELTLLLIHGVLHLLGYDHVVPSDARKMRAKEKSIVNSIKNSLVK